MLGLLGYLNPMFLNSTLMHHGRSGLEDLRLEQLVDFHPKNDRLLAFISKE